MWPALGTRAQAVCAASGRSALSGGEETRSQCTPSVLVSKEAESSPQRYRVDQLAPCSCHSHFTDEATEPLQRDAELAITAESGLEPKSSRLCCTGASQPWPFLLGFPPASGWKGGSQASPTLVSINSILCLGLRASNWPGPAGHTHQLPGSSYGLQLLEYTKASQPLHRLCLPPRLPFPAWDMVVVLHWK